MKIITIEPIIALIKFGHGEIEGGQIQNDLLLWKICRMEFNYTEDICANLTLDEFDEINNEVQTKANNFLIPKEWLFSGPALIWCLFAGKSIHTFVKFRVCIVFVQFFCKFCFIFMQVLLLNSSGLSGN